MGKSSRVGGVILGVIVIAAILAGAIWWIPSLHARVLGVPLKMQWKPGQESRAKTTYAGRAKLEVENAPPGMMTAEWSKFLGKDIQFEIVERTHDVVKSVADGVATIERSTEQPTTYKITLPGSPPFEGALPKSQVTIRVDSANRLVQENKLSVEDARPEEMKKLHVFLTDVTSGFLSGDTRRLGEKWTTNPNVEVKKDQRQMKIGATVAQTFSGVEVRNSVTVADIAAQREVQIDASVVQKNFDIKVTGKMQGSGAGYFDWQAGQIVGSDDNFTFDLALTASASGSVPAPPLKARVTGDVKMTLERL